MGMEGSAMNRKATLMVILVFLLGIALGAVGMRVAEQKVWGDRRDERSRAGGPSRMVEQLTRELALTAEQQQQLNSILEDTRKKYELTYTTIRPQMEQTRQEGRGRIRSMLTPAQLPKFEEYLRRIDEERKNRERR
jgi:Spy/CpxP family protein refolding chaperone